MTPSSVRRNWLPEFLPLGVLWALILLAAILQRTRAGLELGFLVLCPSVGLSSLRALWRLRGQGWDSFQTLHLVVLIPLALLACLIYPFPLPWAWSAACIALATPSGLALFRALGRGAAAPVFRHRAWSWALVALPLCGFLALCWIVRLDYSSFDEGLELIAASEVYAGRVPFRDYFSYKLPGYDLLLAGWWKLRGGPSFSSARELLPLIAGGLLLLGTVLSRRLTDRSLWVACVATTTFGVSCTFMSLSHYELSMALALLAPLAVLNNQARSRWFLAGLTCGLSACATMTLGVALGLSLAVYGFLGPGEREWAPRLRRFALFLLGCAIPVVTLVGVLTLLGGGPQLYDNLVTNNLEGYAPYHKGTWRYYFGSGGWQQIYSEWEFRLASRPGLAIARITVLLLLAAAPIAVLVALPARLWSSLRARLAGNPCSRPQELLALLVASATILTALNYPYWQVVARLAPFTLLALAAMATRFPKRLRLVLGAFVTWAALLAFAHNIEIAAARLRFPAINAHGDEVRFTSASQAQDFTRLLKRLRAHLAAEPGARQVAVFYEVALQFHLGVQPWRGHTFYLPVYFADIEPLRRDVALDPPELLIYSLRTPDIGLRWKDPRLVRIGRRRFLEDPYLLDLLTACPKILDSYDEGLGSGARFELRSR